MTRTEKDLWWLRKDLAGTEDDEAMMEIAEKIAEIEGRTAA